MNKALQVIEEDILTITQLLNEELYEQYNSGGITLEQLEEAYRILSIWSIQSEGVLKLLNSTS